MGDLRSRFTRWYCNKGYEMTYKPLHYGNRSGELIFTCPFWVRPLASMFFSPCVYYQETGYLNSIRNEEVDYEI